MTEHRTHSSTGLLRSSRTSAKTLGSALSISSRPTARPNRVMKLEKYEDPSAFRDATESFLLPHEAENNLIFGLTHEVIRNRNRYGKEMPQLYGVVEEESVRAVAVMTPPFFI